MNGWNDYYDYLSDDVKKTLTDAKTKEDFARIDLKTAVPHCCGTCQNCTATWDDYCDEGARCIFKEGSRQEGNRKVMDVRAESCPNWKMSLCFLDDFKEDVEKLLSVGKHIVVETAEDVTLTM